MTQPSPTASRPARRLIVTASRHWTDPLLIWQTIGLYLVRARQEGRDLIIVHGNAPGGDQIAKLFGLVRAHCTEEGHDAGWQGPCGTACKPGHRRRNMAGEWFCPAAGMRRNKYMVDLGADWGAAFIANGSHGATGCAKLMQQAGIPVERHRQ